MAEGHRKETKEQNKNLGIVSTTVSSSVGNSSCSCSCGCLPPLLLLIFFWPQVVKYWLQPLISVMSQRLDIPVSLAVVILFSDLCIAWPLSMIYLASFVASPPNFSNATDSVFRRWLGYLFNLPIYKIRRHPALNLDIYLGINIIGGVIPVALALYQLMRVPLADVAIVTAVVAPLSYFSVKVFPKERICLFWKQLWLIALIAVLTAQMIVAPSATRLEVPVAFAGSVFGILIGADLLHIKDLKIKEALGSLSIGGAGSEDGIIKLGLMALYTAEWFPNIVDFIEAKSGIEMSDRSLFIPMIAISLALLVYHRQRLESYAKRIYAMRSRVAAQDDVFF